MNKIKIIVAMISIPTFWTLKAKSPHSPTDYSPESRRPAPDYRNSKAEDSQSQTAVMQVPTATRLGYQTKDYLYYHHIKNFAVIKATINANKKASVDRISSDFRSALCSINFS